MPSCPYCERPVSRGGGTLEHVFPRSLGSAPTTLRIHESCQRWANQRADNDLARCVAVQKARTELGVLVPMSSKPYGRKLHGEVVAAFADGDLARRMSNGEVPSLDDYEIYPATGLPVTVHIPHTGSPTVDIHARPVAQYDGLVHQYVQVPASDRREGEALTFVVEVGADCHHDLASWDRFTAKAALAVLHIATRSSDNEEAVFAQGLLSHVGDRLRQIFWSVEKTRFGCEAGEPFGLTEWSEPQPAHVLTVEPDGRGSVVVILALFSSLFCRLRLDVPSRSDRLLRFDIPVLRTA